MASRTTLIRNMLRGALQGAVWGSVALLAILLVCVLTVGIPVFQGVLKWDMILKKPETSLFVLLYFLMGLPFAAGLGALAGVLCARLFSRQKDIVRSEAEVAESDLAGQRVKRDNGE